MAQTTAKGGVMEKYHYGIAGVIAGALMLVAVGKLLGVSDTCIYFNACEYEEKIERLQTEIRALNEAVIARNQEIQQSTSKIAELQSKAKVSIERAQTILAEIRGRVDPTLDTLTQIERYVKKQREVQKHVIQILCANNAELADSRSCSGG